MVNRIKICKVEQPARKRMKLEQIENGSIIYFGGTAKAIPPRYIFYA